MQGRHAAYELAEPGLRELFSVLNELRGGPPSPAPSIAAGTCYDHLSGRLGVALFDALADAGAIEVTGDGVRLGEGAEAELARFGVAVPEPATAAHGLRVPGLVGGAAASRRRTGGGAGTFAGRARVGGAAAGVAGGAHHRGGRAGAAAVGGDGAV